MCRPTKPNPLSLTSVALLEKEVLSKKNPDGTNGNVNVNVDTDSSSDSDNSTSSTISTTGNGNRTQTRTRKRVAFSHVALREYSRTVGDHPNVKGGVPLALDWKYAANDVFSVDQYEELRCLKRKQRPRTLDMTERICLLRCFGISDAHLRQAEKQRKVRLTQEWAYGRDTFGAPKSFSLSTTKTILKQYVV